jgi:hypothetical protein
MRTRRFGIDQPWLLLGRRVVSPGDLDDLAENTGAASMTTMVPDDRERALSIESALGSITD